MLAIGLGSAQAQPADGPERALEAEERARRLAAGEQDRLTSEQTAAEAEEQRLVQQRILVAASLQDAERAASEARARLDAAEGQLRAAEAVLHARAEQLAPLLPLLQRLAVQPTDVLLTIPAPPDRVVSGLMLLRALGARLEREVAGLAHARDAASVLRAEVAASLPAIDATANQQRRLAAELDLLIAASRENRSAIQVAIEQSARRVEAAAQRASDLRQAIARIEQERRLEEQRARLAAERAERVAAAARDRATESANPVRRGSAPRGAEDAELSRRVERASRGSASGPAQRTLLPPLAGRIVRNYGERGQGGTSQGLAWQGQPTARVISPCSGRVVFSGGFRSYGRMLILDCGGGYHFVLAGLDRIDVRSGVQIAAGEPVGLMADYDVRGASEPPLLYGELRHNGLPVDPAPFLRTRG
jgi:septal ring factor EnvC (AmiA/AmiB activator)